MLFNENERILLSSALETYDDEPRGLLKPELQHKLVSAALTKLNALSTLTHFTKQEFTVMALALQFIINTFEETESRIPRDVLVLSDRLIELASPAGD